MDYKRYEVPKDYLSSSTVSKCNVCGKDFKEGEGAIYFSKEIVGQLHVGFFCKECADNYEKWFLNKNY